MRENARPGDAFFDFEELFFHPCIIVGVAGDASSAHSNTIALYGGTEDTHLKRRFSSEHMERRMRLVA